jgi:hypothetical protein
MTDTAHSEGPWYYRESDFDPHVWEVMADWCESPVAEVPRWKDEDGNDSEEAKANRSLIAAAPALLAACRLVVERWLRGDLAEAARACHAAIDAYEAA